jgi:hypothetical protein
MQANIFTPPHPLNTAVLFLVFNRFDTTKRVFEMIRQARPPMLYIAADGARKSREGEKQKVKEVRDYVMSHIDWECKVKTLFQENNLGCKYAVSSSITWFFEHEEKGIILEDDCLPSLSFFWFCEELLEKYQNDRRVWQIGGCNFQEGIKRGDGDYYFSIYNHIWGWAGWANRWRNYDVELDTIKDTKFLERIFDNKRALKYWTKLFNNMKAKQIDTWDYQWTFTMWFNNGLVILPNVNLISNIGFGVGATHTTSESEVANLKTYQLIIQEHPSKIIQHKVADECTYQLFFTQKSLFIRIKSKIKRLFNVL